MIDFVSACGREKTNYWADEIVFAGGRPFWALTAKWVFFSLPSSKVTVVNSRINLDARDYESAEGCFSG